MSLLLKYRRFERGGHAKQIKLVRNFYNLFIKKGTSFQRSYIHGFHSGSEIHNRSDWVELYVTSQGDTLILWHGGDRR